MDVGIGVVVVGVMMPEGLHVGLPVSKLQRGMYLMTANAPLATAVQGLSSNSVCGADAPRPTHGGSSGR
jgi:hypothetical protein